MHLRLFDWFDYFFSLASLLPEKLGWGWGLLSGHTRETNSHSHSNLRTTRSSQFTSRALIISGLRKESEYPEGAHTDWGEQATSTQNSFITVSAPSRTIVYSHSRLHCKKMQHIGLHRLKQRSTKIMQPNEQIKAPPILSYGPAPPLRRTHTRASKLVHTHTLRK